MARLNEGISAAWRALDGESSDKGWRSIPVLAAGPCVLRAGRHFPGNLEALLAGFDGVALPHAERLPDGAGFVVSRMEGDMEDDARLWLSLSRHPSGDKGLFAVMVADVAEAIQFEASDDARRHLQVFLGRVRAWQEFMRKGAMPLGLEAEVGLVGELCFLCLLVEQGMTPLAAVEAWEGPLDGVQDFVVGTGAVEVKSTVARVGFPAKIGTLEQLDDSVRMPLFIAAQRLALAESGMTLSEWIDCAFARIGSDGPARTMLFDKILSAGYRTAHAQHYVRRFSREGLRLFRVGEGFPRLLPGTVPAGIRKASYEIDLDQVGSAELAITDAMNQLGVF